MSVARAAVLGHGLACSVGIDPDEVVAALAGARCGLVESRFGGSRLEGRCVDPPMRAPNETRATSLLRATTLRALNDAGIDAAALRDRHDVALVIGTSAGAMDEAERLFAGDPSSAALLGATYDAPTLALARELGLRGPVETIASACASGALAIAVAARWVASGEVDLAIAGGVDALSRFVHVGFDALGALAAGRPKPFRVGRDGLALGEGAGIVVLAPDGHAARRGRVLGAGGSCDARHITAPDREGAGLADAIRRATRETRDTFDPSQSPFVVHLHGTATPFNDAMEARALESALGSSGRTAPAYGVKHAIGHTLGASGAIETVITLACLAGGVVPPTASDAGIDPDCAVGISNERRVSPARHALKLSAAFGGMNCALWLAANDT